MLLLMYDVVVDVADVVNDAVVDIVAVDTTPPSPSQ